MGGGSFRSKTEDRETRPLCSNNEKKILFRDRVVIMSEKGCVRTVLVPEGSPLSASGMVHNMLERGLTSTPTSVRLGMTSNQARERRSLTTTTTREWSSPMSPHYDMEDSMH